MTDGTIRSGASFSSTALGWCMRIRLGLRLGTMFNTGPEQGEAIGNYEGDPLYHASLVPAANVALVSGVGFELTNHAAIIMILARRMRLTQIVTAKATLRHYEGDIKGILFPRPPRTRRLV
jgi:hypothetical protein